MSVLLTASVQVFLGINFHQTFSTLTRELFSAALAVDRAICLKYPMQRLTVCSRQRAILTTAVIVLIVILLYLPTIVVGMVTKYQQGNKSPVTFFFM